VTVEEAQEILKKYVVSSSQKNLEPHCEEMRVVQDFFNNRVEPMTKGAKQLQEFSMVRNINNFIKAAMITQYVNPDMEKGKRGLMRKRVLDIGCYHGKDIAKYIHSTPSRLVGIDVAAVQLIEAERRWKKVKMPYPLALVCADATSPNWWQNLTVRLFHSQPERVKGESRTAEPYEEVIMNPGCFDIISCQQMIQYAFASPKTADSFLDNVANLLSKGGYFFGSMPDFSSLQTRLQESSGNYETPFITLKCDDYKTFNTYTPYTYCSKDTDGNCSSCVEYAISLTDLIDACQKRNLRYVMIGNWAEFLKSAFNDEKLRDLRTRMKVQDPTKLNSTPSRGYSTNTVKNLQGNDSSLKMASFDVICLNQVFCFRKF
jgi:SAM-dependent methyltransferase